MRSRTRKSKRLLRDHADGMDLFPKARVWLQKDELQYYAGEAWQSRTTHGGIDPDDVIEAVKLNAQGRVGLVNGDAQEILPGIICYTGGRHTYASQFVGVNTKAGIVVLASDNVYLYENVEKPCANRRHVGCRIESARAGPHETTGCQPKTHNSGPRSGGAETFSQPIARRSQDPVERSTSAFHACHPLLSLCHDLLR